MTPFIELFTELFCLSAFFWGLLWLFVHLSVMRFIVPRYEKETGLIDTIYFKKLMPFAEHIPSFWSSIFYIVHLAFCLWSWRWIQHSKILKDIDSAEDVIGHFSVKEIRRIKLQIVSLIIVGSHFFAFPIIKWKWPGAFD